MALRQFICGSSGTPAITWNGWVSRVWVAETLALSSRRREFKDWAWAAVDLEGYGWEWRVRAGSLGCGYEGRWASFGEADVGASE